MRPNCEGNWNSRVSYSINWKLVWKSLGTPISDPTEEKTWRKMLHRAIIVRSRFPNAPSHACRLGCGCTERMLHLAQCPVIDKVWCAMCDMLQDMNVPAPEGMERAILFGQWTDTTLGPACARAVFRHTWGAVYRHLVRVETDNVPFSDTAVVRDALTSIVRAIRRRATEVGRAYNHTLYSLRKPPPAESINVLKPLVDLGPEGEYALAEPLRRRMSEHDVL